MMTTTDVLFIILIVSYVLFVFGFWLQYKVYRDDLLIVNIQKTTEDAFKSCLLGELNMKNKYIEELKDSANENRETLLYILQGVRNQNALLIKQLDVSSGCTEKS